MNNKALEIHGMNFVLPIGKGKLAIGIGQVVRKLRIESGFTQKQLAQKVGISRSAISRYETGEIPELKLYDRIAQALCYKACLTVTVLNKEPIEAVTSEGAGDLDMR